MHLMTDPMGTLWMSWFLSGGSSGLKWIFRFSPGGMARITYLPCERRRRREGGGITWHGGSVACTACTAASQQEGHGFDSRMGRCGLWGAGPPQSAQCSSGLSPFCVEFACSPCVHKGFPPLRTPTEKTCKTTEHMSIPDQRWTVHFTWSPGAAKLPTAPGGSLRKDGPGWEKAENKFTATSGL